MHVLARGRSVRARCGLLALALMASGCAEPGGSVDSGTGDDAPPDGSLASAERGWVRTLGSDESGPGDGRSETTRGLDVGPDGRVVITGDVYGDVVLDAARTAPALQGRVLDHAGEADALVAWLDRDGTLDGAVLLGGAGDEIPVDVAHAGAGEALVLGALTGEARLGAHTLVGGRSSRSGDAVPGTWLASVRDDGEVRWAVCVICGDDVIALPSEVAIAEDGSIAVMGSYLARGDVSVGADVLPATGIDATAPFAGFVARLGSDGSPRWARAITAESVQVRGSARAADGDVLVTGEVLRGEARFATAGGEVRIARGGFAARLSGDGATYEWALGLASEGGGAVRGVAPLGEDVVIAGTFSGTLALGASTLSSESRSVDVFVARLDALGVPRWARALGGPGDETGAEIAIDGERVLVAGGYAGCARIDGSSGVRSRGGRDLLVVELDASGLPSWAAAPSGGATGDEDAFAIAVSADGDVVVGGPARGSVTFGVSPGVEVVTESRAGGNDLLVVQLARAARDASTLVACEDEPPLRTPDDAFVEGPWDAEPRYVPPSDGLRLHYVDEGPRDAPPVLLVHGVPTWSFVWRDVLDALVARGHRVIAPDLIGFGRSDKPVSASAYSYEAHVRWLGELVSALDLRGATLVVHDWGGQVGMTVLAESPERFAALVLLDTSFNAGEGLASYPASYQAAFAAWLRFLAETPDHAFGEIVERETEVTLGAQVIAAYDAPFPTPAHEIAVRVNDRLCPLEASAPGVERAIRARDALRDAWSGPTGIFFSTSASAIHPGQYERFVEWFGDALVRSEQGIESTRHFLQEDRSLDVAERIDEVTRAIAR
ncbi:MAG: alpha/beta fold hydrolase [Deltaproteobacteria bacterium]